MIEAQTFAQAAARQRAYAFSLTSAAIFKGLGLWPQVAPQITHFRRVSLSDGDYPRRVVFTPQDAGEEAVYYGAEHGVLMAALQAAVEASETIHCWSPAQVQSVEYGPDQAQLQIQADDQLWCLSTPLVVAADGMRSQLRQQAGIGSIGWTYWQSCITAILKPAQSHDNTAYERFWPSGPFAILPLPGNRCQIVWTAPHQEAQALIALPREQFMAALQRRYGDQMGALTLVSQPLLFPVRLRQSHRYGLPRLALVGDAAHCCHPVGGQGLNMGIRDAAALAEVLLAAQAAGEDWGSLPVLRRYDRWRRRENWLILGFTDLLNRSFFQPLLAPGVPTAVGTPGPTACDHATPRRPAVDGRSLRPSASSSRAEYPRLTTSLADNVNQTQSIPVQRSLLATMENLPKNPIQTVL
ncbi:2-octaprenyl-3-methyl-6-methoxy-1,4-benzoquinol hydroxylase [Halomicronema hongdechloris C2206]|uniref:2-octaprenyl-3-methyl-6-methoxy-1,4-benzoquinol hydroxylase n=1 Tax=Halomicronema hongdechloris C2206 TaxID=1641165 RepID=A0A1Z3HN08_9CYAN|nr:FAD-dependent hydroxylase [Halomicronema hongdechloris]ASC71671.1 2-octaprenyl-3-methyl-6-methoxy-1,4-benzoquinol hydroxylase [Halomicronema hongdechloris C2206]